MLGGNMSMSYHLNHAERYTEIIKLERITMNMKTLIKIESPLDIMINMLE
jgi:hypothetical protein